MGVVEPRVIWDPLYHHVASRASSAQTHWPAALQNSAVTLLDLAKTGLLFPVTLADTACTHCEQGKPRLRNTQEEHGGAQNNNPPRRMLRTSPMIRWKARNHGMVIPHMTELGPELLQARS